MVEVFCKDAVELPDDAIMSAGHSSLSRKTRMVRRRRLDWPLPQQQKVKGAGQQAGSSAGVASSR
jgi:hypothetical protein